VETAQKISVIIPAYNAARWIAKAIDSAASQTLAPCEIIVVDDGSTDDTPLILSRYGDAIRAIRQENAGVSAARNAGMRQAAGDWLAFLDADDIWLPEKLARVMAHAAQAPQIALFSHDVFVIDEMGNIIGIYRFEPISGYIARKLVMKNWIITSTAVMRADAARESGWYHTNIKRGEDWHYWIRVASKYPIAHIHEPMAMYRRLPEGALRSDLDACLADNLQVVEYAGRIIGLTGPEMLDARAGVYRESVVRRLASLDPAAARRELAEVKKLAGWTATDAGMWLASLFPSGVQRLLLRLKKIRDSRLAKRRMKDVYVKSGKS